VYCTARSSDKYQIQISCSLHEVEVTDTPDLGAFRFSGWVCNFTRAVQTGEEGTQFKNKSLSAY